MRAADTSLLVRVLTRDNPRQASAADEFIAHGAWISHLVLVETLWVLGSVRDVPPGVLADAVEHLLGHEHLTLQEPDVVARALAAFRSRPSLGFSDCLILEVARKAGHVPLGTSDQALAKLDGTELVGRHRSRSR